MYIDKVLLTIVLCTTSACCCADDRTLTRTARTIGSPSSFLAWPSQISKNLWTDTRPIFWEWTRNGAMILVRLASLVSTTAPMRIEFRPEDGPRAAEAYRRRFGYRGEWLIEQLGNGLGPDVRPHGQPVPDTYLNPPLSRFSER